MLAATIVPVFKLYGETRHWPTPDLLHCESIPERSLLHDWRIRPHRHTDLVHVLLITRGSVDLELEGAHHHKRNAGVIVVPAMTIHGFCFSPDVKGHIVTLAQPLADHLGKALDDGRALRQAGFYSLEAASNQAQIVTLVSQIDREYRHPAPERRQLLEVLALALAIELERLVLPRKPTPQRAIPMAREKGRQHFERFHTLVEQRFREQPGIEALARELGLSRAHLNLLCRQQEGRSALQILHERLLLEAKRQLTYTNMTIAEIADGLGFSEPAYFTRFFKRNTTLAPRAFRKHLMEQP
ncbi:MULTISPECIES: helix-turn-helix domain-containing protein [unclassified Halomonas]|uniref:helix-turn-helix domain-containing protein n=1 Tax=unclassified Halomonas TaxID=2609666 RepID=UPI00209E1E35|nr:MULTISPECIES: helix-turn-helix domain-containing protein [unclassified Halomonas]MCP1313503.1 helix-turn-helix domain-containing protein [Halomonas sp. 707D7]MCP1327352.1 helix-turn-helix domain-containing protein [Halomonas sp. 707D4]